MARSTDILPTGHLLSWYRVDGVLGTGGFGITYLAHDTHLDQQVAIKEYFPSDFAERQDDTTVLPRSDEHDELYEWGLKSFMSEAKTMARFRHQSIVRVLSVFPEHGTAYMVMEYERGQSLAQALRGAKTWDESALMRLVEAISGALREIHEAGFIHRDIKPDNIYLRDDGTPVLLDFGSARQAVGTETQALTALVSPGYAPFEQYDGGGDSEQKQGPWTDLYALGAVLYRAVTGKAPPDAMQRMQALLGKLDPMTPAVLAGQGRYSTGLLCAIDWALSLRPDDRPRALDDWLAVVNGESEVGVTVRMPARDAQTLARPQVPATGTTTLATDTQPTVLADDDGEDETVVAGASGAVETQFEEATVQAPPPVGSATNSPAPTQGSANWKTSRVLIPAAILVTLSAGVAAWTLLGPSDSPGVSPDKGPPIVAAPVTPTPTAAPKAQIVEVADSEIAAQVRAALEEGRVSGAEQRLAELERVSPNHPDLGELHDQLLSAKTRADLVEQLALAKAAFDDGRLLAPINDNALTFYRDAVGLEPHNDIAEEGIDRVAVRVASAARAAIAAKEFNKAQALLSAAAERKLSRPELAQASKALATAQQQALTSATVDTALALSKAGRFDAALEALDRLGPQQQVPPASRARAEIVTTYSSTLLTEIRKTEGAGNFTDALATLERLEALDPENAAISTIRGRIEGRQRAQKAATARADRIKQLLAAADADIAALRLTSPAGRNALERLREISSLDPDNADAQQRLTAIVKRYLKLALQRSRSGDYAAALRFVAKAEGIDTRGEQAEIAALKTMFADAQQANEIPPPTPIAEAKPAPAPIPASPPAVVEVPAKKPAIAAPPKPAFTVSAAVFPSDTMNAGSGHFEKKIYRQMAQGIRGGNAVRTVFKAGVDKPSTSAADFWSGTRPNVGGIRRAAKTYEADLVFVASITGDSMFEAQVTVFAVDLLTGKMTSSNVSPDGVTGSVRAMLAAVKNRR